MLKDLLVAEEAMARWIAGAAVREERVERRVGTPGSGALVLKRWCWAVICVSQSSWVRGSWAQSRSFCMPCGFFVLVCGVLDGG